MRSTRLHQLSVVTVLFLASAMLGAALQQPRPAPAPVPGTVMMVAKLVNPEQRAAKGAATVQVTVTGAELVDPATAGETPVAGQAHLHYQVDSGVVVATPIPKLSFHDLKPGDHVITITLAANDHTPLGARRWSGSAYRERLRLAELLADLADLRRVTPSVSSRQLDPVIHVELTPHMMCLHNLAERQAVGIGDRRPQQLA